ncbi:IS3 family transposase [Lysinibacillus fusiformis]
MKVWNISLQNWRITFTIYTNKRMKVKLKGMSPAQYRVHS